MHKSVTVLYYLIHTWVRCFSMHLDQRTLFTVYVPWNGWIILNDSQGFTHKMVECLCIMPLHREKGLTISILTWNYCAEKASEKINVIKSGRRWLHLVSILAKRKKYKSENFIRILIFFNILWPSNFCSDLHIPLAIADCRNSDRKP